MTTVCLEDKRPNPRGEDSPKDTSVSGVSPVPPPSCDDRSTTQRMATTDVDTAVGALSEAYSEVTLQLGQVARKQLRMEVAMRKLPNITLGSLQISASTVSSAHYPLVAVCLPIGGQIRITTHTGSANVSDRSGVVVSPGCPVVVDYLTDDCHMETLLFEQSEVEAELSKMLGQPIARPLRFELPLSCTPNSSFHRALDLLHGELTDDFGLAEHPAMSAQLGRLVITGLLLTQPNTYTEELTQPSPPPGTRAIRNALALIEDRPADIVTVGDIASAVGLSVRALDDGFRRHIGMPPMTHLRNVRMARAHDELIAAHPDSTSATIVARKWGFGHYGRFAAKYQERYGRKPSESLRGR